MTNPLKQGLKLSVVLRGFGIFDVVMTNPLKQGLKLTVMVPGSLGGVS